MLLLPHEVRTVTLLRAAAPPTSQDREGLELELQELRRDLAKADRDRVELPRVTGWYLVCVCKYM